MEKNRDSELIEKARQAIFYYRNDMTPNARLILVTILLSNDRGQALKQSELMKLTGIKSAPTIKKAVDELEEYGFIKTVRRPRGYEYYLSEELNISFSVTDKQN